MKFKSKAQAAKFAELVKAGKMSKATFDKAVTDTKNAKDLPVRAPSSKIKMVKKI